MAFACVLENNSDFAKRFLRECGYEEVDKEYGLLSRFQWTSAYGRPDLAFEISSESKVVAAIHVEVKVGLEPKKGQIKRHLKGLENRVRQLADRGAKGLYSRLVVLSRHDSPQFSTPPSVKWLSWNRIHDLLAESEHGDPVVEYLTDSLAEALEVSEMVEFGGFDVEEWKECVRIHEAKGDLIDRVEEEAEEFVDEVKTQVKENMKSKTKPYDILRTPVHERGYQYQFWINGMVATPMEHYHVGLRVEPWEGWIETSIGAEVSTHSAGLLENLRNWNLRRKLSKWAIWYRKGGNDDETSIDAFEEVIEFGPKEASMKRRIYHIEDAEQ